MVRSDLRLRLWCLTAKGYTDLNMDYLAAKRDWLEAQEIAKNLGDDQWATRAVGNDGIVGTAIFLGSESTCSRAVVAVAGQAFRISAMLLLEEFERNAVLQRVLLRYTHALITQISQTAVCNRLHSVEQRLCRHLLMCDDRTGSSELLMTQELIAHMLGGRRESVTVAAGHLQDMGLIHYCRGHITILNRGGLEASACECYRIVEEELARLSCAKRTLQIGGSLLPSSKPVDQQA